MSLRIYWTVTEDLTPPEIQRAKAVFAEKVVPALPAIARDRPAATSLPYLSRAALWLKNVSTIRYAEAVGNFVADDHGLRIVSPLGDTTASIHFKAGDYSCETLGFQDYAVLSALAGMSSESGKVILTGAEDRDEDYVRDIVRRVGKASGSAITPADGFASGLSSPFPSAP